MLKQIPNDSCKKIIVLGCPGSGKSTFSRKLHDKTGLPLFHLDNIWWKPDKTHITREEFDEELKKVLESEKWIIDGDYSRTYEVRIAACDTVVFLDFSEEICMSGIVGRIGKDRPDIPWTEKTPDIELVEMVKRYKTRERPALLELFKKYPDRQVLVFTDRLQADNWLNTLF